MKLTIVVSVFALSVAGTPAWAERPEGSEGAVPRAGGGGGDRGSHSGDHGSRGGGSQSSGATARQPSSRGGGSSHSSTSSDRGGSSSQSYSSDAQRRHPRAGSGTGRRGPGYYSYRHDPYYWYSPRYYGSSYYYDWWYGPGFYGGGYYPGHYSRRSYDYDDHGSLRLQVKPENARVYVDGYDAGVVDDFNGLFQRLNLPPGRHELSFKLDGYRTHRMRLYVPADQTLKVRYDLVPGGGDETLDSSLDRPALDRAEREEERAREQRRERRAVREQERERERDERRAAAARDDQDDADEREPSEATSADDESAALDLRVTPDKAAVYVDGSFRGTGGELDELSLSPGRHRVEVVAPGYKTFDREVDVKSGDNPELTVELERP